MVDETPTGVAPNPVHPTTPAGHTFMTSSTAEPVKTEPKVDHLNEIAELAKSLHNVSPSGAETVSAKILQHIADIKDPKAYDERMAAEKKASDEAAAASKKAKDAANKADKVS
jgi:hypothetical protein